MSVAATHDFGAPESGARRRLTGVLDAMRRRWTGRHVVITAHTFNGGLRALADELVRVGSTISALVTVTPTGPDDPPVRHVWSCAERGLPMSRSRFEAWLDDGPPELLDWLDSIDPDRSWSALGSTYATYSDLGGRPACGRWRPQWAVWEDKTRIDELWSRLGVPAPAHVVLPLDDPRLSAAAAGLDHGAGVMVAMDATRDVLGSSLGNRWVRHQGELADTVTGLRGRTDRVRLATFVPGVPCSAMGMVLPDGVAVFDPIEVVTLHHRDSGDLVYGGTSTWWRPDPEWRERLRAHARTVGRELADSLGYTGVFSIDGVLGEDGFAATEVNPRHVSGLGLRAGWPEFLTRLLNRALQDGWPEVKAVSARDVETAFRAVVRRTPSCSLWIPVPGAADHGTEPWTTRVSVADESSQRECEVRCRAQCGGVWLLGPADGATVPTDHGALAPLAAALARSLGAVDVQGYDGVTVRAP
jgi:hypothetical protein